MVIRIFPILLFSLIVNNAFGQPDSNTVFKASRGKWALPINNITEIGTFTQASKSIHGCPTPSISFISDRSDTVRSVFAGKVIMIGNVDEIKMILVKYGDYFITYTGLKDVFVKKDELVFKGQNIGTTIGDDDHLFELEIYVTSRELINFDPEPWFGSNLNGLTRRKF